MNERKIFDIYLAPDVQQQFMFLLEDGVAQPALEIVHQPRELLGKLLHRCLSVLQKVPSEDS